MEPIPIRFKWAHGTVTPADHVPGCEDGPVRRIRLGSFACGVAGSATLVKQGSKRQGYSDEDGHWYAYSLLNSYRIIAELAKEAIVLPTRPVNQGELGNTLLSCSHLAIWARV